MASPLTAACAVQGDAGGGQPFRSSRRPSRHGGTATPPFWLLPSRHNFRRGIAPTCAAAGAPDGLGAAAGRALRKLRASLPIVGLVARLVSAEGGVDAESSLAYPEFCRALLEAAPPGFDVAVAELERRHGRRSQRRYVLLCLWMARLGGGVLPGKVIVDAARRLSSSFDLEMEVDRFAAALAAEHAKYSYLQRPSGSVAAQAEVAADALARLCCDAVDGEALGAEDASDVAGAVAGGLWDVPGAREAAAAAISSRPDRSAIYKA
jgi:hypothetical protein